MITLDPIPQDAHVRCFIFWRLIKTNATKRTAKRWGKLRGFHGAQGGWVYRDKDHQSVCQGWSLFFDKNKNAIIADIANGFLKVRI